MNFSVASVAPQPANNWTVSNGTITAGQGSTNIDVTWGTGTGNVNVTASNTCGVSSTRSQSFTGTACREPFDFARGDGDNFIVYPNPAHDKVTVSIYVKDHTNFNLELRDISGRVIISENHEAGEGLNAYDLELKNFAKGIYTLEVRSAADNWKTKIIVE